MVFTAITYGALRLRASYDSDGALITLVAEQDATWDGTESVFHFPNTEADVNQLDGHLQGKVARIKDAFIRLGSTWTAPGIIPTASLYENIGIIHSDKVGVLAGPWDAVSLGISDFAWAWNLKANRAAGYWMQVDMNGGVPVAAQISSCYVVFEVVR